MREREEKKSSFFSSINVESAERTVQRQLKSWKQYYCGMWTWDWRETTVSMLEKRTVRFLPPESSASPAYRNKTAETRAI